MKKYIYMLFFICCTMPSWGQSVLSYKQEKGKVVFTMKDAELYILPLSDNAVRVKYKKQAVHHFPEWVYVESDAFPEYTIKEKATKIIVALSRLVVEIDRQSGQLSYYSPNGNTLLKENTRELSPALVQGEETYCAEQAFYSPSDEFLYGLGQFQDGYLNLKGLSRRLTQVNTQIAIPFVLSNKGYGILWNNYGLTDFNPADHKLPLTRGKAVGDKTVVNVTSTEGGKKEVRERNVFAATLTVPSKGTYSLLLDVGQKMARKHHLRIDGNIVLNQNNLWLPPTSSVLVDLEAGSHLLEAELEKEDRPVIYYKKVDNQTVFRSPVAEAVDYTVFAGNADEVIASYRKVTGEVPMLPSWAMGYIHCRERFHYQQEILETASRFRRDSLPMDVIVQDWQYWGKYGWNAMRFDERFYPDPKTLVDELHAMNARLMVSVWSKIDPQSEIGKEMQAKGYYIPNTSWIDFFNPEAAAFYWQNFSNRLLKPYGIDAWWQDATEPENDDLEGRKIMKATLPGELYRNAYPLLVNKTVYEGSRKDVPNKRTMILTRSGFSGMQRYAAATWSGDIGNDWETFRRQIIGGLGIMASGFPWWTYDAGGFFRPGEQQYVDERYHECFLRWLQTSVFLPLMRVHGYMTNTEFWNYGEQVTQLARKSLDIRYRLFPYIYSEAASISFNGSTLMRPLVMDFADDVNALSLKYEYMFGPSLLVAPVVNEGVKNQDVYFPKVQGGWYDFWTGKSISSSGWKKQTVTLDHIPVYVKAGTVLPLLANDCQHTVEAMDADWEIRVFAGADGSYTVYEDEGVNYNYEQGASATIRFTWNDKLDELTIHARKGKFEGMNLERKIRIVKVDGAEEISMDVPVSSLKSHEVVYKGEKMVIRF